MRYQFRKDGRGYLLRFWARDYSGGEVAYVRFGLQGLRAQIEFPSDWHEHRRAWVTLGFGVATIAFSFPWSKVVPDEGQCEGPTYGFYFHEDNLVFEYGKSDGGPNWPKTFIQMPWGWRHREHKVLSEPETHPYRYKLRSGEVQERTATIKVETRLWTRPWIPWRKFVRAIDVEFSDEVGERTGSWKGGTIGCGYTMLPHETPVECLRRMERERKF